LYQKIVPQLSLLDTQGSDMDRNVHVFIHTRILMDTFINVLLFQAYSCIHLFAQ